MDQHLLLGLVAHVRVALSTDEAKARQEVQIAARFGPYARMFAKAGFLKMMDGDEGKVDALAQTLVVSGTEATVRHRLSPENTTVTPKARIP